MNIFKIGTKHLLASLFAITIIISLMGCFATTNYYTGRTLDNNKMVLTAGFDNMFINFEGDIFQKDEFNIYPSIGLSRGFPKRFEGGFRWYFLTTFEGTVRWEMTPESFKTFDLSTNLHYGTWNLLSNYFKYGLTMSRQFYRIEPYISYYQYADGNINISYKNSNDLYYQNRVISAGISHYVKGWGYVVPEVNFQFLGNEFDKLIIYWSIGFRFDFFLK
jgi:hypothetical protein